MAAAASASTTISSSDLPFPGGFISKSSQAGQVKCVYLTTPSVQLRKHGRDQVNRQALISSRNLRVSAEYERSGGAGDFFTGFVLGGVVFGALGYLLAPQVSKTVSGSLRETDGLSENLSKSLDDDEGIEKTRRNLNEKIAQLNAAIDNVSAQLRADDGFATTDGSTPELESAV